MEGYIDCLPRFKRERKLVGGLDEETGIDKAETDKKTGC